MKAAKVISHVLVIEYICPVTKETHTMTLNRPSIYEGKHYEDDTYSYVNVKCECGKSHSFEIW